MDYYFTKYSNINLKGYSLLIVVLFFDYSYCFLQYSSIFEFSQIIKSTDCSLMLIKASKSPVTPHTHRQIKRNVNNNDVIGQIVKLTKQNQFLKSQIQCLKTQLDKFIKSKNKYKSKYAKLKNQNQTKQQNKKSQLYEKRREKSGKIYRQGKLISYSPINKHNQSNYDIPSTRSDLNRVMIEPRLEFSQNKFIEIQEQNPYHINKKIDKAKSEQYVLKINIGIQSMVKMLQNMMNCIQKKEFGLDKFAERILGIQNALSKLMEQIKVNFSKIQQKKFQKQDQFGRIRRTPSKNKSFSGQQSEDFNQNQSKNDQDPYGSHIKFQTNQIKKQQQKMKPSKHHHKSLNPKRNSKSQIKKSKIREDDKCSSCSSWQILNQIGKQLTNWKFSYADSSPFQISVDEPVKDSSVN